MILSIKAFAAGMFVGVKPIVFWKVVGMSMSP